jgi:hypothetical protein
MVQSDAGTNTNRYGHSFSSQQESVCGLVKPTIPIPGPVNRLKLIEKALMRNAITFAARIQYNKLGIFEKTKNKLYEMETMNPKK